MASSLEELKKQLFYDMLNIAGRVFVAIRDGDDVVIGKRGFLPEEKEKGLVLVFNQKMNFTWDDAGISVTLVFGTSPEKCFIPQENIITIFSPELNAQFSIVPGNDKKNYADVIDRRGEKVRSAENIIRVDFRKK